MRFKSDVQLPPEHSFYHIANSEGALVLPPPKVNVRDANDFSRCVEEGPRRDDLRGNHRWETRSGRPRKFTNENGHDTYIYTAYLTQCVVWSSSMEFCVLYDTYIDACSLYSCNIYFTDKTDVSNCEFKNCVLITGPDCEVVFCTATRLDNCTLKGNFAEHYGSSDLQRTSTIPPHLEIGPYEVHNNVVFTDRIVDLLCRWVYSFRIRRNAKYTAKKRAAQIATSNHSFKVHYLAYKRADDARRQAEPCGWKSKAAGKRKMHVDDQWNVNEQLAQPERRSEWSVQRVPDSPSRKRKVIDLDG